MRNHFASAGVRGMSLHHDRTAGCQRGGSVSACHGKSQWKVARAEYSDRTQCLLHTSDIGLGRRLPIRVGRIDASINPRTFPQKTGEKFQLIYRSSPLTGESSFG
jgi:hypothetical protein